jgi:glycosyltransferase involved in cell wall biosynthesis
VKPLKIAIDARVLDGAQGGVQQIVLGLAVGLKQLTDGDEEYHFLVYADSTNWLTPHMGGNCHILMGPPLLPALLRPFQNALLKTYWKVTGSSLLPALPTRVPVSCGLVESAGMDVVHFPLQTAFTTTLPSIYQPQDLQHLHYPQYFSRYQISKRETLYRAFCKNASLVALLSRWGKADLVRQYGFNDQKVAVVPGAAITRNYPVPSKSDLSALKTQLGLDCPFFFYPAQTFPHKNHLALLQAFSLLNKQGQKAALVCTGSLTPHFKKIKLLIQNLQLQSQTRFLGWVTPLQLHGLYQMAHGLVFPSQFEGWGLPITEAFDTGLPVAASNTTSIPEQTAGAALLFNPDDPQDIATALRRMLTEKGLRQNLILKGKIRSSELSWEHAARIFRAHYRHLAKRPLSSQDQALIEQSLS